MEDDVNQTQDAWDLIWTTTEMSVKQLSRTQKTIYLTSDQVVGFPSLKPFVSKVSLFLPVLSIKLDSQGRKISSEQCKLIYHVYI